MVAVLVNATMLLLVNWRPGWRAVPILTPETAEVLPEVNASVAVAVVANIVYLVVDRTWMRALGDVLVTAVGIVALVAVWQTFPFAFPGQTFAWETLVRVLLILGLAGSATAIVATLARWGRGHSR